MTLSNAHARIALATSVLLLIGSFIEHTLVQERRFAALDTRLAKLESAIKTLNATTPDDRYKQLIKELMAEAQHASPDARKKTEALPVHGFLDSQYPADTGASSNVSSTKPPQ